MRPRLYTTRNFALLFVALLILGGMAYWLKSGMPLPGVGVASTAGKIAFLSDRGGHTDLYMMNADGSQSAVLASKVNGDDKPTWAADGGTIAFVSGADTTKGSIVVR